MTTDDLIAALTLTRRALGANLDGIDDALAMRSPGGGANSVNWLVGHILVYRDQVLRELGATPVLDDPIRRRYDGRDDDGGEVADPLPLGDLVRALDTSQERLVEIIGALTDADLERLIGRRTVARHLAFLHFHESYHVGQVAYARRLLGLPGVIRPPGSRPVRK